MISDTLFGWNVETPVSVPVDAVKDVSVRRISVIRSAAIPATIVFSAVLAVLVKNIEQTQDPWKGNSHDDDNSTNGPRLDRSPTRP